MSDPVFEAGTDTNMLWASRPVTMEVVKVSYFCNKGRGSRARAGTAIRMKQRG